MALFRNFGVNRRNRLCGIQKYASAQFLDFLELVKNCTFLDRKLISALFKTSDGHYLTVTALEARPDESRLLRVSPKAKFNRAGIHSVYFFTFCC